MIVVFYILLLGVIGLVYRKHKNILHPFVITSIVWLVLPLLYELFAFKYPKIPHLSSLFYYYIAIYLSVFLIISELIVRKKIVINFKKIHNAPKILNDRITICYYFILLSNLFLIIRFFTYTGGHSISEVITNFRVLTTTHGEIMPRDMKLLLYMFSLTMPLILYTYIYKPNISVSLKYVLLIELCLLTLFYCNKTKIVKYIIAFILLFYFSKGKLKRKHIIYAVFIGLGFILGLTLIRDTQFLGSRSLADYLYVYSLSPLYGFDSLIQGNIKYSNDLPGERTLTFFYSFVGFFFDIQMPDIRTGQGFIRVPGPNGVVMSNVYSGLGNFYMDWGVKGIVGYALVTSIIFSVLYKNINNRKCLFIYILTIYCLVFNFFGDFCFKFLSQIIQDVVAVLIIFHFKKKTLLRKDRYEVQENMLCGSSI